MSSQTLFGRRIEGLTKKDAPKLEERVNKSLPIEVNPRILEGMDPIQQSFVCAIANSSAEFKGKKFHHALYLGDGDITDAFCEWIYNVLISTSEGREAFNKEVGDLYHKITSDLEEALWSAEIKDAAKVEKRAHEFKARMGIASEEYKKDVYRYDKELFEKAKDGTLKWEQIEKACKSKSYIAQKMFEVKGILSPYFLSFRIKPLEFSPLRSTPNVSTSSLGTHAFHSNGAIQINPAFIGGNRHDEGAEAIAEFIGNGIEMYFDLDTFEPSEDIPKFYHAIDFLRAQGYTDKAQEAQNKLQETYVRRFVDYLETVTGDVESYFDSTVLEEWLRIADSCDKKLCGILKTKATERSSKVRELLTKAENSGEYKRGDFKYLDQDFHYLKGCIES